jgi:hypothetical protein
VDAVQLAAGRRLALPFVFDAVFAGEFGADECLAAEVAQFGVFVETGDDVPGELWSSASSRTWPSLVGLRAMMSRTRCVSNEPIQIDAVAMPVSRKSTAMSAAILSTAALGTP